MVRCEINRQCAPRRIGGRKVSVGFRKHLTRDNGPAFSTSKSPSLEPKGSRLGKSRLVQSVRTVTVSTPGRRGLKFRSTKEMYTSAPGSSLRSEEHTSELQSLAYLVCRLLL